MLGATDVVSPHSLDAERALLGAILIENAMLADAAPVLEPGDFFPGIACSHLRPLPEARRPR